MTEEFMEKEDGSILQMQLERLQNSQAELFSLDRQKTDILNELRNDFTEMKTKQKYSERTVMEMKDDIAALNKKVETLNSHQAELKTDIKTVQINSEETQKDIKEIKANIENLSQKMAAHKWTPKDYVLIICAALSTASAIIVALLSK